MIWFLPIGIALSPLCQTLGGTHNLLDILIGLLACYTGSILGAPVDAQQCARSAHPCTPLTPTPCAQSQQGLIPAVRASARQSTLSNARAVLTMALLDEDVGAILGKRGQTLTQIQQVGVMAACLPSF